MHTELVRQINELPIPDRVEIIEEISRGVRHDMRIKNSGASADERKRIRSEAIRNLRGIASVPGKKPPTDEECREDYANYLTEKYK